MAAKAALLARAPVVGAEVGSGSAVAMGSRFVEKWFAWPPESSRSRPAVLALALRFSHEAPLRAAGGPNVLNFLNMFKKK
ncbi:hypothetical protein GCM10008096_03870 [Zhihengliuella salsuginis]|uniref:Uncharacterized protein n=1 Tax=Zhihengliuella salsuginis TaxID=578222 RepID=A0ABQ3GBA3_9MICC|nr:hypothetical protein GCM10008096_03870 [Zhihengliuella salsuginis]